jgi:hypothetical protein
MRENKCDSDNDNNNNNNNNNNRHIYFKRRFKLEIIIYVTFCDKVR